MTKEFDDADTKEVRDILQGNNSLDAGCDDLLAHAMGLVLDMSDSYKVAERDRIMARYRKGLEVLRENDLLHRRKVFDAMVRLNGQMTVAHCAAVSNHLVSATLGE